MKRNRRSQSRTRIRSQLLPLAIVAGVFLIYWFSNPGGGVRNRSQIVVSWIAIVVLTIALWLHANPGGWQFSYRYGMILLPWMFLILLNNGKKAGFDIGSSSFHDFSCS